MSKIEVSNRRSVFGELKDYCMHSGDRDYMEITAWANGEGFDIMIERNRGIERFSLSHGEWELLQVLMNWKGD